MDRRPARLTAFFAALATALFLIWSMMFRFVLSNDEGIFTDGALRILHGQAPYRDFFILMGPGTFWLNALAMRIFGGTLAASRVVTVLDLSVIAACVCWVVARLTKPAYGFWVAAIAVILETADPVIALPNHRWDSAALAIAAATILIAETGSVGVFLAGACAAFAAVATPTVALVGIGLIVWMFFADRGRLGPFLAGGFATALCSAGLLAWEHALWPMIQQMLWTGHNYSAANWMPYGSRVGGYRQLFEKTSGPVDVFGRLLIVGALTMPALLPPVAALFVWPQRRMRTVQVLSIAGLALVAATYPRMDVPHLAYGAPLFYALLALLAIRIPRSWARMTVFALFTLLGAIFLWYDAGQRSGEAVLETRAGRIRASRYDANLIRTLDREIRPGEPFFSFPYFPLAYFLTGGENPTRYSYLQAGMMSDRDEAAALAELEARPPEKVLYLNVTEKALLKIWPGTDRRRLRLYKIESYLAAHYDVSGTIQYPSGAFEILTMKEPEARSQ